MHIVASPRGRAGTTLLARVIADSILFAGGRCRLFDTDAADRRLAAYFPEATVVDIGRVTDQMKLFDALAAPAAETRVVDVAHRAFRSFFDLAAEFEYFAEAKARGVEPVIFYLPDASAEAHDGGRALAAACRGAGFVLVANAALDERLPRVPNGASEAAPHPRLRLRRLDPFSVAALEDTRLSLSDFLRRASSRAGPAPLPPAQLPLAYLSLETRNAITAWLRSAFDEIDRVLVELDLRSQLAAQDPVGT